MANTAKNKIRAEEAERMVKGSEVTLTTENYNSDFLHALNYYNANHDDKDKKKWLIKHLAKTSWQDMAFLTSTPIMKSSVA